MIVKRRKELMKFYFFVDIIAIIISFLSAYWIRFYSNIISAPKGIPHLSSYWITIPFFIIFHLFYFSYQGYYKLKLRRNRLDDLFLVTINSFITSITILLIFSYLKSYNFLNFEISHIFLFIYTPIAITNIFTLRSIIFKIFKNIKLKKNGVSKILIAGEGILAELIKEKLLKYTHFGIEICGLINDKENDKTKLGKYKDFTKIAKKYKITDLFVAIPAQKYSILNNLVKEANNMYIDVKFIPDIIHLISFKTEIEHIEGIPTINLGTVPLQGHWLFIKRTMDLVLSILGLIVLTPLFITIAALIKISSKGPIFYKQQRVGRDGKLFNIYKFRSMIKNAEKSTGAIWSPKNDLRITPIGKFLRKYSLDELPQLINVIKGDMSLVGPRPERPELVTKFMEDIPSYMLRHKVKSGMTGWAQVHGFRGNTPLEKRIDLDIIYIQNWSLKLDLEILWRTILKLEFIDRNI